MNVDFFSGVILLKALLPDWLRRPDWVYPSDAADFGVGDSSISIALHTGW